MNAPALRFSIHQGHDALAAAFAQLTERAAAGRADGELTVPEPFAFLATAFGLTGFERDLLMLVIGAELDARLASALRETASAARVAFRTAAALLADAHLSSLAPSRPLRRWRLIEPVAGVALLDAPLTVDERIVHFVLGQQSLDPRLAGVAVSLAEAELLAQSQRDAADRAARALAAGPASLVVLTGADPKDRRAIAAAAAAKLGLSAWRLDPEAVWADPPARAALARLVERETALIDFLAVTEGASDATLAFLQGLEAPVLHLAEAGEPPPARAEAVIEAPALDFEERRQLWRALAEPSPQEAGECDRIAYDYPLPATDIAAIVREVKPIGSDRALTAGDIRAACRRRAARPVGRFVERLEPQAVWEDLVLPPGPMASLRAIASQVRRQPEVYRGWGFGRPGARGLGVTALFAGPSGAGKTMAAEALARDLDLECLRIDLSQVVSKYIGETAKNLDLVFQAGERGGALLLFDEADALFGKRSDVKDSHDRYANIEIGYLLQKMESYQGPAILTSNLRSAIDEAFLRRLRFVVHFPFPDQELRAELWRRVFPAEAPLERLDFDALSRMGLSGGNIRTVALNAAFLAAEEEVAIGMAHVRLAAQAEMIKLQRSAQGLPPEAQR
jgi:hypothetical protein